MFGTDYDSLDTNQKKVCCVLPLMLVALCMLLPSQTQTQHHHLTAPPPPPTQHSPPHPTPHPQTKTNLKKAVGGKYGGEVRKHEMAEEHGGDVHEVRVECVCGALCLPP